MFYFLADVDVSETWRLCFGGRSLSRMTQVYDVLVR